MPYRLQPADVQAKFEEYRCQCDANIETVRYRDKLVQVPKKIIYTLEGFCLFLDIGDEELKKYEDNKNYRAILRKIRYLVMCRKMHALVNGEGNTRGLIFDLKVNHGIDPKQAREEQDWKVTLNLNHDEMPAIVTSKSTGDRETGREDKEPEIPGDGKPGRREEEMGEEKTEQPADIQTSGTGGGEAGRKENDIINHTVTISLNKKPVDNTTAGPPKQEKMNPYSVW